MVLPFLTALAPFAPLIGGAVGAVGSLLRPAPKPQVHTTENRINIKQLRDDAEAAGFNPLTIIRGGGLAGYGSSTSTSPAAPDTRLSDAFMTFGSGVAQFQYDPYAQRRSEAEIRLAEAQIAQWGRTSAPGGLSFQTPKAVGSQPGYPGVAEPELLIDVRTSPVDIGPNPAWSNAQEVEDRYGDVASWLYGIAVGGADLAWSRWLAGEKRATETYNAVRDWYRHPVLDTGRPRVGGGF